MTGQRRWRDLDPRKRRRIVAAVIAEGGLKTAALVDIARRPARQIRGPKWIWAAVVTLVNSFGAVPVAYFVFGRQKPGSESA
ncbi:PLD nuclease N-terminal domain-containing protein [Amycolatopsis taiwanensis]|uniref:PLD nuclease N-terminal domain-containing protein n=1 Tax=Amycolatopsis taiwanensis TaxID=342230 RepID=UPI0004865EAE|nr:PLD nuclease N-terminal domain-containing protein [Amycolatopsis taiwanensis]